MVYFGCLSTSSISHNWFQLFSNNFHLPLPSPVIVCPLDSLSRANDRFHISSKLETLPQSSDQIYWDRLPEGCLPPVYLVDLHRGAPHFLQDLLFHQPKSISVPVIAATIARIGGRLLPPRGPRRQTGTGSGRASPTTPQE